MIMENTTYMIEQLKALTGIPSPTGMTLEAARYVFAELQRLGFAPELTRKGTVICCLGGEGHPVLMSAHVDTLGAMVRAIKGDGRLRYTKLGGYNDNAIENENVLIHTLEGKTYSGTVQSVKASRHVWGDTTGDKRGDESLEIVIDEDVSCKADVEKLGITPGNYISFDPRMVVTESGYIKSRHLDDKASSAVLLALARGVAEGKVKLGRKVYIVFTVYEEVGHGASSLYTLTDVEDMIAVDMGCVGSDLSCNEKQVSLCAKDSNGPYDYSFLQELVQRCKEQDIDYVVDIYPGYGSDAGTALRAGMEIRYACFGQGVFASHAYERTHIKGMEGTLRLLVNVAEKA